MEKISTKTKKVEHFRICFLRASLTDESVFRDGYEIITSFNLN